MQPSSFEKAIRLQFDCLIRKVIDCTVKNYNREIGRRAKHERPFCEVPEIEYACVGTTDEDSMEFMTFQVFGSEVRVHDERLCEAIMKLSEKQRNILLMFYFLEMSDAEISEVLGIARCTVYRNRMRSLDFIRDRYRRNQKK